MRWSARGGVWQKFSAWYNQKFLCGPLAQLVEQLTLNQRVAGSSPARLTTFLQCIFTSFAAGLLDVITSVLPTISPRDTRTGCSSIDL